MILKKLPWAGVLLETKTCKVLIDPLGSEAASHEVMGMPLEELPDLANFSEVSLILITHVHPDHFDPQSIREAFGPDIPILLPEESADFARKAGFSRVVGMGVGSRYAHGEVVVVATHTVDGFGTPQVAWLVEADGQKIIHCGDTLWHGYWWKIVKQHGPINAACLPVNGPVLQYPGLHKQSEREAAMSPEQAVEAAYLLDVKTLVPIHYGTYHNPPYYIEAEQVVERVMAAAEKRGVEVCLLKSGESFTIGQETERVKQ